MENHDSFMQKRGLCVYCSLVSAVLFAWFWTVWYSIFGQVPVVSFIAISAGWIFSPPFEYSRWWDIAAGPIWVAGFFVFFTREEIQAKLLANVGLIVGLIVGAILGAFVSMSYGIFYSLKYGLDFGIVHGLLICWASCLGLCLSLCFGVILGLGAGFALGFGLAVGLAYGLAYGFIYGPLFGLAVGLAIRLFAALVGAGPGRYFKTSDKPARG